MPRAVATNQAGGELVEIGLADDQRASLSQQRDHGGVLAWPIREGRAGRGSRHAGDVDVVLNPAGNAPQWLGYGIERAERRCLPQQRLAVGEVDEYPRVRRRGDPLEYGLYHSRRR